MAILDAGHTHWVWAPQSDKSLNRCSEHGPGQRRLWASESEIAYSRDRAHEFRLALAVPPLKQVGTVMVSKMIRSRTKTGAFAANGTDAAVFASINVSQRQWNGSTR